MLKNLPSVIFLCKEINMVGVLAHLRVMLVPHVYFSMGESNGNICMYMYVYVCMYMLNLLLHEWRAMETL